MKKTKNLYTLQVNHYIQDDGQITDAFILIPETGSDTGITINSCEDLIALRDFLNESVDSIVSSANLLHRGNS